MINCINISKVYNQQVAIDNVTLSIEEGDFVVIMGPSGSGKSTLLNLMAGIDSCSSGKVLFAKYDYTQLKPKQMDLIRQSMMGFIFQEYHIIHSLSVYENIALPLMIKKMNKTDINKRVNKIMEELDIFDLAIKMPYELSGGEKQRVAIARALVIKPDIIFADEPTGALDSKNAYNLLSNMQEQNEKKNITTVMVSHDPFTASFAKKVIFLKDGKIFHQIDRGNTDRKAFFEQIMKVSTLLGGEHHAV